MHFGRAFSPEFRRQRKARVWLSWRRSEQFFAGAPAKVSAS
jgi:hypothetical protein